MAQKGKKHPAQKVPTGRNAAGGKAPSARAAAGRNDTAKAPVTALAGQKTPGVRESTLPLQLPPAAKRVVIVGGGASGMAAAIAAARAARGTAQIVLLEKQPRVGRKLLATGSGRCNLGHLPLSAENYVGDDRPALEAFLDHRAESDPAALWRALGLLCREEEGRLYPYSNQASAVLDVLRAALQRGGVLTVCGVTVQTVKKRNEGFLLQLTQTQPDTAADAAAVASLYADRLILACGGAAAPALGGGTDGFALAEGLGHRCTALAPGLTGLIGGWIASDGDVLHDLGGTLRGVRGQAAVTLLDASLPQAERMPLAADTGEIQFNEDGVSGIPVLQLSLRLARAKLPVVLLDLLPQLTDAETEALLRQRLAGQTDVDAETLFLGTIHKRLAQAVCRCAGVPLHSALTADDVQRLAREVKALTFAVTGTAGWAGAQTTVGGVPLAEVAPATCASRLCPGLYLTGELLDAAGECGGFNLDWAFSTGLRAGRAAIQSF